MIAGYTESTQQGPNPTATIPSITIESSGNDDIIEDGHQDTSTNQVHQDPPRLLELRGQRLRLEDRLIAVIYKDNNVVIIGIVTRLIRDIDNRLKFEIRQMNDFEQERATRHQSPAYTPAPANATSNVHQIQQFPPGSHQAILAPNANQGAAQQTNSTQTPNTITENGLVFQQGAVALTHTIGLPLTFHQNLMNVQGLFPITIPDPHWQEQAANYAVNRTTSAVVRENETTYKGFPYLGEFSQNSMSHMRNLRRLAVQFRTVGFHWLAERIEAHITNVEHVVQVYGSFIVGFRYCVRVRRALFAPRLPGAPVPDPGVWMPLLVEEVYQQCRILGDLEFDDNHYAIGGPCEHYEPTTGRPKHGNHNSNNNQNCNRHHNNSITNHPSNMNAVASGSGSHNNSNSGNNNSNNNNHNNSNNNQSGSANNQNNASGRQQSDRQSQTPNASPYYKGRNFDPNYKKDKSNKDKDKENKEG